MLFVDERILSSDPDQWHSLVEEAADAERYSRRMAKRQREGHAAKRRRGEPGGRPPFGFRREGRPPVLVEIPERVALVRQMFRWGAEGLTDREIAERTGLERTHVAEVMTNRIYAGELRDGNRRPAVIGQALFDEVQEKRARYSRRRTGPVTYRKYLWSGRIRCRECKRNITGRVRRYEHVDACAAFQAARPSGLDHRCHGASYKAEIYDSILPRVLSRVTANAAMIAEVQDQLGAVAEPRVDEFRLARIRRERQQATRRLEENRDTAAWRLTMERLDREEAEAKVDALPTPTPREVADSLSDLVRLFLDAQPETQQRIARALFEQVEVLGPDQVWLHPSLEAEARGWTAAMDGEFTVEVRRSGRGERI